MQFEASGRLVRKYRGQPNRLVALRAGQKLEKGFPPGGLPGGGFKRRGIAAKKKWDGKVNLP